jgi:hypothetical protein
MTTIGLCGFDAEAAALMLDAIALSTAPEFPMLVDDAAAEGMSEGQRRTSAVRWSRAAGFWSGC